MMSASTVHEFTLRPADGLVQALQCSGVPALKLVTVFQSENTVILTGRLPSYYLKQLAQEAVIPHLGQCVLDNRITVLQH